MDLLRKHKNSRIIKLLSFLSTLVIVFFLIGSVNISSACGGPDDPCPTQAGTPDPKSGTSDPKAGTPGIKINTGIKNPISPMFSDIPSFIKGVLRAVLLIGIPIVTLAIIYTGFLFVTAQGNSEKLKVAKKALVYTLVGAALLLGSLVITDAIQGTVDDIKKTTK